MGEYHSQYIKGLFKNNQEYQDYRSRKIHVNWKESTRKLFSDIYTLENSLDEKGIPTNEKNTFLDLFVSYAKERRNEIENLEWKLRLQEKEHIKKEKKIRTQKNIVIFLCTVLLAIFVATSFFFYQETKRISTLSEENWSVGYETGVKVAKEGLSIIPPNADVEYVASENSDKYHRLSCRYSDQILEGNRIYYKTMQEAEEDGKSPCSVCLPENSVDTFTSGYYEARERLMGK